MIRSYHMHFIIHRQIPNRNAIFFILCYFYFSVDQDAATSGQKGAAFPFKATPSGNLKVQSNQVMRTHMWKLAQRH